MTGEWTQKKLIELLFKTRIQSCSKITIAICPRIYFSERTGWKAKCNSREWTWLYLNVNLPQPQDICYAGKFRALSLQLSQGKSINLINIEGIYCISHKKSWTCMEGTGRVENIYSWVSLGRSHPRKWPGLQKK